MSAHLCPIAVDADLGAASDDATQDVAIGVHGGVVIADRQIDRGCRRRCALGLCLPAGSRWLLRLSRAVGSAGGCAAASYRKRSNARDGEQVLHSASVVPLVLHSFPDAARRPCHRAASRVQQERPAVKVPVLPLWLWCTTPQSALTMIPNRPPPRSRVR